MTKKDNDKHLPMKFESVGEYLAKNQNYIKNALPKHLDAKRMIQVALTSVARNPALLNCDIKSLLGAVIESSQIGLYPDSVLGHAALVPFKGKVQLIIGYKGFIELARRSQQAIIHVPQVVYENDIFDYRQGTDSYVHHKPCSSDRGRRIGAYAVAEIFAGAHSRTIFEFLRAEEIEELRDGILKTKKNPQDSPWVASEDEMWRKTPLRRLAKFIPQSPEDRGGLQRAAALDEMYEAGVDQNLVFDVNAGDVKAKTEEKQESLKKELKAPKYQGQKQLAEDQSEEEPEEEAERIVHCPDRNMEVSTVYCRQYCKMFKDCKAVK